MTLRTVCSRSVAPIIMRVIVHACPCACRYAACDLRRTHHRPTDLGDYVSVALHETLGSLNPHATVLACERGRVELTKILGAAGDNAVAGYPGRDEGDPREHAGV